MRPAGAARAALLAVLQAGFVGHCEVIARQAGVPHHQARRTMENLCREQVAAVHGRQPLADGRAGRPRALYGLAKTDRADPVATLASAMQAWR